MKKRFLGLLILAALILLLPASALAQSYSFGLERETVNVYWNSDGTESIDYVFAFNNDPTGHAIEYVDLGLPNSNFVENSISADVNGNPVSDISASGFEGTGSGVAVGLGRYSIPPGQSGEVHVFIGTIRKVLRPDSQDNTYASGVFAPAWFEGTVHGTTNVSVTFHLPPGVQPDEPRWHAAPGGFNQEPATGLDNQGRVTYTWSSAQVVMDQKYEFGASFPKTYVPASAISNPSLFESLGISADAIFPFLFCGGIGLFILVTMFAGIRGSQKRKLQYLPPKIAIEGHGIKRGLTAIEAAILLEEPMDKILTMILFAVIKKGAATVTSRDPLTLDILQPQPEDLQPYEKQFVEAFAQSRPAARRSDLQDLMISLVKSVSQKMKGFSRKETVAYYRDIMKRAWAQVEAADTPEVKSQKYDDVMEWTMLDRDYERRTQDVFRGGPVFVPIWWGRFDPGFGRGAAAQTASMPSAPSGGGGVSLPHLPGSDFAASVVRGTQSFSSSVVGNLTDFTSKVTNKTNPVPVSTSRGGGSYRGGGGCACACACAGCACACAGGGR